MDIRNKVIVVTGAANGIGRALSRRFAQGGARAVVLADLDIDAATRVADEIGGKAIRTDVSVESDLASLVGGVLAAFGQIDLFCSNAGIALDGGPEAPDESW